MKLRDLLELCRVSNLPTVWSNVIAGFAIGTVLSEYIPSYSFYSIGLSGALSEDWGWHMIFLASSLVGISLIYCGGMILNDYWDRSIDQTERPSRPIPSGRVQPKHAKILFLGLFIFGFLAAGGYVIPFALSWPQMFYEQFGPYLATLLILIGCIVVYNIIHQSRKTGVLIMGLCRALAYLAPTTLFLREMYGHPLVAFFMLGPAITLFAYTVLISIVARREVEHDRAAKPRRFMGWLPGSFGGPKTIMNMIAAMPLLDAMWLVVMGLWPASLFCVACAGMTKLAHRRIAGS